MLAISYPSEDKSLVDDIKVMVGIASDRKELILKVVKYKYSLDLFDWFRLR